MDKIDNRGWSLVEIIVAIAIISIVTIGGITGLRAITEQPVTECSKKLESALTTMRAKSLGKIEAGIEIEKKSDGVYITEYVLTKEYNSVSSKWEYKLDKSAAPLKICDDSVDIKFTTNRNAAQNPIQGSTVLKLYFDRKNGSFKDLKKSGIDNAKYSVTGGTGEGMGVSYTDGEYCTTIVMTTGSKTKTLTLSHMTGKVKAD